MKIAVFVVGCVLALPSAVVLGLCLVATWLLQHPPSDLSAYNPHGQATPHWACWQSWSSSRCWPPLPTC
jgi:hypothetical protein